MIRFTSSLCKIWKLRDIQNYSKNIYITKRNLFKKQNCEEGQEKKINEEINEEKVQEKVLEKTQEKKEMDEKILKLETQLKYMMAEVQNIQKRVKKQVDEAKEYGASKFIKDMFEVSDILETVIEKTPKEVTEKVCSSEESEKYRNLLKELIVGLEMTMSIMNKKFESHGIEKCFPLGEKFDHNFHLAKFQVNFFIFKIPLNYNNFKN